MGTRKKSMLAVSEANANEMRSLSSVKLDTCNPGCK